MEPSEHPPSVHVGVGPDGTLTYLVDRPPEALPPVLRRDLERAWHAARDAALAQRWGDARGFRFRRDDGSYTDLALADRDARCWAGAVDVTVGMGNSYGLSLCLRLLALVDLLARVSWAERAVPAGARRRRTAPDAAAHRGQHAADPGSPLRRDRLPKPACPARLRLRAGGAGCASADRRRVMSRRSPCSCRSCWRVAACEPPPPPTGQARADAATLAACRERADAVYDRDAPRHDLLDQQPRFAVLGQLHARRGRSRPAATLWLREHDARLRAQYRHRDQPLRHSPTGTHQALNRRSRPRWPACQQSAASWRSAMRASSTPAASRAGPVRGCSGSPPTGWPGN